MSFLRLSLAIILLTLAARLHCQGNELVIHARPLHVLHFDGTVVDSKGMTVEYAMVELHSAKDHSVIASTFADSKGFFSFDDRKYGRRIEICISQKGFNPAQYTVMRRPFGDPHLRLVLTVAN